MGKHASRSATSATLKAEQDPERPTSPLVGALDEYAHAAKETAKEAFEKAKGAAEAARSAAQNPDAMDEVKEELSKGKGRVVFFFIILLLNICLGKFCTKYVL